jgi:hypothetical protein
MQEWQLTADRPLSMRFAADTRLGRTDYIDDQSWEITFGGPDEPALTVQTRYGGRAGLARLVPMWLFEGRSVYEGVSFAERPTLRAFAPNYARITARPISTLALTAEIWVMDSQAIGGRFTMVNSADQPAALTLEIFAQVVRDAKVLEMSLLGLDDGSEALHLGQIGNLNPVLVMDNAVPQSGGSSTKLAAPITIPAGGSATVRWVHAGKPQLNESLRLAYRCLKQVNWGAELSRVEQVNARTPVIETGNADWDVALALSNQLVLRSFVGPTGNLPNPSIVSARIPARGFSAHGDGSDHGWQWNGQNAALGYFALPSVAILAPDLARGLIRNALAVKQPDGWIDFKPGLAGQRARMLSLPLLATSAWRIYELTEDKDFITEVLPGLRQFFERWFQPDCDRDGDGFPEWVNTTQSGYVENPTFARFRRWAQNADINRAESPDLAAYLISEGHSLLRMADLVGDSSGADSIRARVDKLTGHLDSMWNDAAGSYLYRDRDTDQTLKGVSLFRGKGDEAFDVKTPLDPPNRLILRIVGGKENPPQHVSVVIEGIDAQGNHVSETVPGGAFAWYYGMGAAVSERVYSQINYIKFEGVIRLYSLEIDTVDLTRQNLTQLLPLWAAVPTKERAGQILKTLTDPARYWRAFGLPICPANDPAFAADNDGGSGGVWMLWNAMLLEGLLSYGYTAEAVTLLGRLLNAQVKALQQEHAFRGGYNSETGEGLGDIDELDGILPLSLFMQVIGVRILNERKVWAGGPFGLAKPVKVTLFGVEVTRSAKGSTIKFPSGYTREIGPEWQVIEDPTPPPPVPEKVEAPETTESSKPLVMLEANPAEEEPVSERPPIPADASLIPVDTKKDDTVEIPINKIDFTPKDAPSTPPSDAVTVKIPVRRPKTEQ